MLRSIDIGIGMQGKHGKGGNYGRVYVCLTPPGRVGRGDVLERFAGHVCAIAFRRAGTRYLNDDTIRLQI